MAIKIKRDVNPMAAAYGSKIGGKGKRQTEDAKILASLQRSGGGMGGSGGGGGARASAPASLISAPSGGGGAPLGSLGGVVTPSAVTPRGNGGGGGVSGVSSPGGRKKGYFGSTSARALMKDADYEGYRLSESGTEKNPVYKLRDANGKVVRTYSQAQYDFLQKRGHSNSTMDRLDSAAFFRSQDGRTATERAADIREEEQNFRAGEADKTRKFNAEEGAKDRDYRAEQERLAREARQKELEDERKWRENQQLEKERREMRRDTLRREGYSEESILKIEENTRKKESIEGDANLTPEQKTAALEDIRKERDGITPSYEPMPDPNDPAQSIREVTLSDGRKVLLMRDARGNWSEFVPNSDTATALQESKDRASRERAQRERAKNILDLARQIRAESQDLATGEPTKDWSTAVSEATKGYDEMMAPDTPAIPAPGSSGDYSDEEILAEIERRRGEAQRGANAGN